MTHGAILGTQREETLERLVGEERVLLVQDSTSFNYSHHPATTGMGPLENPYCQGFLVHSTLAVSTEGTPLGLLEQQVWVRTAAEHGKSQKRHETAYAKKESYKWVKGLPSELPLAQTSITVCDRESHIYEFLAEVVDRRLDFIVRAMSGRSFTLDGQDIFAVVAQQPVQTCYTLALPRRPEREARDAQVELRFGSLTLNRPQRATCDRETLTVQFVEVLEVNPPDGQEAVHWLLLTSLPVDSVLQAQTVVRYYTYRWLIERFHYTLKSGCKLEERQLRDEPRLERLLAVFNVVAWKLLWLTYQARLTPDAPCTRVLQPLEW